jgi:hypothetical protein
MHPVSLAFTDDTETGSDPSRLGDPNLICDTDIGDRKVPDVWFIDNLELQHWGHFIKWAAILPDTIEWSLLPISSCARVGGRLPPRVLGGIYSEFAVVNSALAAGESTISSGLATWLELESSKAVDTIECASCRARKSKTFLGYPLKSRRIPLQVRAALELVVGCRQV